MALSLEKFEMVTIRRSQIKGAPYNPRTITPQAKRRLKAGIKKLGMLGPIQWNKRTGNLVGGHQRLAVMDLLVPKGERIDDGKDYELQVAALDLNEIQEQEANLLLNNQAAQGDFDLERLSDLLRTTGLDIEATGWDQADMFRILGHDTVMAEQEQAGANLGESGMGSEALDKMRASIKDFDRRTKERHREGLSDYFLVVVFKSHAARERLTSHLGLEDNRYHSAADLGAALVEHGWPDDEDGENATNDD